jgi:hypothetical protein
VQTRILFLDDSGKPDAAHASRAVVIGGFAIDAAEYPTFSRRILGAKNFYPGRGVPQAWELKSSAVIKPNPWKRLKNRSLCAEVARLGAECGALGRMGMVVADWSSHQQDQHASRCVASFVASRGIQVHPGVYYASSHSNEGIQASDLLAGVRRRVAEGDANLSELDTKLSTIRACTTVGSTTTGRAFSNWIRMF